MVVDTRRHGRILVVRLNRPEKRNAVDAAATAGLDAALNELEDDPDLWAGVLCGTPQAFSAGTDLKDGRGEPTPRGGSYGVVRRERRTPLIAAVEGFAYGGGFEIVLTCDLVVAARTAKFALPEVSLGVVADCGALFRTQRALPVNIAKQLLLTGQPLTAERAYTLGLVNELTEPGETEPAALRLAEQIVANAPVSVAESLHAMAALVDGEEQRGWDLTAEAARRVDETDDRAEGVAAFLGKRPPTWSGR
ncbi:enoyl-CoA hydratase-related protein [Amycolatopsis sp. FDAARGOS 1241]|uniref:enoyl-CoA hydratase-related protein n=1 Tax=Amycolatopsis sp. FDAARGOS 1241 TaxID=2778070 RepID=UPI00195152C3|nr:enoyl-CoA hydratase-related protein [Amycolatopsis sp. FDAARGOS 1241]QRP48230.1 enoyl-CoA hydratase/isomerase family protein [Amycolatopsis sp. FDAARGOS 1241]